MTELEELAQPLPSIDGHTVTQHLLGKMLRSGESVTRYRWRCTCGRVGRPTKRIGAARTGAIEHVDEMERGGAGGARLADTAAAAT